jgi:spore germination protein YaaH
MTTICGLLGGALAAPVAAGNGGSTQTPAGVGVGPHVVMDESNGPLLPDVAAGGTVTPLLHPVNHFSVNAASGTVASTESGSSGGPEVFGFIQNGEVTSGDWRSDLQFNLLSTIAYDAIDVNYNGSLIDDAGSQGWTSQQATNLFSAAHAAGDRVVATFAYLCGSSACDNGMDQLLNSSTYEATFVQNVVQQVTSRGVDGVNIDFEPDQGLGGDAAQFTALMSSLKSDLPSGDELSVDTYASAYQGGEMWSISSLAPVVDAIDVMTYGLYSGGNAQPNDPLAGPYPYTDTSVVNGYLGEMPASKLILGIPYYGVTYSTTSTGFGAPYANPPNVTDPYYSTIQYELASCALPDLTENYDTTSQTAWDSWSYPPNGNCTNFGSLRELYYDSTQSLEARYQLVDTDRLRGIGIWALGMDSGSSDYWNAIAGGFDAGGGYTLDGYGGVHPIGDSPPVDATGYWPGWTIARSIQMNPCDPAGQYSGWVMDGFGGLHPFAAAGTPMPAVPYTTGYWPGWSIANDFTAFCITVAGVQHVAGCVLDGFGGLHAWADSSAVIGDVSCGGSGYWPGWDIATKMAVIPGTDQGYVMDGFGGLHPFNGAPDYNPSGYWPGWTIARGIVATANGGYTVDGFGGIHPFGSAPAIAPSGYWPGWDIVRGITVAFGGTGVMTLDGFGEVHPAGGAPTLWVSGYWPGWDIVIGVVSAP